MDEDLRSLFDRTLRDEPPPPANLAQEAMASGTRLRRRRGLLLGGGTAGVVAVLVTVLALNMGAPADPTPQLTLQAAMARAVSGGCTQTARTKPPAAWQTTLPPTDVAVFLAIDITDRQRRDVESELRSDGSVRSVVFESRQQAYAKFKEMFADDPGPEFVNSVTADQLPDSFRAQLVEPSRYAMVVASFERMSGVDEVVGYVCPRGLPSREGK